MDRDLLKFIRNTLEEGKEAFEEGKSAFDASRESSKERRIKEESDEPIAFVFPNQEEIPENLRKHLDNFTGVMADLFGTHVTKGNYDESVTETGTPTGEVQDDVYVHQTAYPKLSPFSLVEGRGTLTLLVHAVGFSEKDISIRFVDDELIVIANSRSTQIDFSGSKIIAGDVRELLRPIYVRLPMPDVVKEKTEFTLSNGLLEITFVKEEPKSNVFIVK